ncbi:hypothetical protein I5555_10895 [Acinetobacter baumannii]|uniref:hypothetical protein n=1 Tax=Acinetobacter baumannii TaxID=470 RepID=UPI0018FF9B41|nr:hypothetical protein [Acinetobacter baumannii]MBJ9442948.1 hypothetical protein [Acinetobacter baumannii]
MTLVITSNQKTKLSLGNVNGIKGSQDWCLFLDFAKNEFVKKSTAGVRTNINEADALICTSNKNLATKPMTMDQFGSKSYISAANQLRHWGVTNAFGSFFGLLIESDQTNWFLNSAAPATQTIASIPAGSTLVASCIGSGSLKISGNGINTVTVTENTPATITPQGVGSEVTLSVEVVGSLTHAQVVRCAGFATVHTPITTTSVKPSSGFDRVEINPNLLTELIDTNKALTVVVQSVAVNNTKDDRVQYNENRIVLETDTLVAGLGLNKDARGYVGNRCVSTFKSDSSNQASAGEISNGVALNQPITQVFFVNELGFKGCIAGGRIYEVASAVNLNKVKRIRIAENIAAPSVMQGGNCIITKIAIFNKTLTNTEIQEISKSWL